MYAEKSDLLNKINTTLVILIDFV